MASPIARIDGPTGVRVGQRATWRGVAPSVDDDAHATDANPNDDEPTQFTWDAGAGQLHEGPTLERAFDDLDRAHDARTEAARIGEENLERRQERLRLRDRNQRTGMRGHASSPPSMRAKRRISARFERSANEISRPVAPPLRRRSAGGVTISNALATIPSRSRPASA